MFLSIEAKRTYSKFHCFFFACLNSPIVVCLTKSSQLFSWKCILQQLESYSHKEDSLSLLEAPSAPHLSPSQLAASCTPTLLLFSFSSFFPVTRRYSETVLKSFLSPSKCGAKTHGSCAASLLCAKERAAVHDNKGRMKGLALGAELEGQTPSLPSFLPMQPHMHIEALTKLNNRPSELST